VFLKIFLYDPGSLNRVATLLRNGAVCQRQFTVYESHIPYLLQLFIDYNLFGMGYVHLTSAAFRVPVLPRARRVEHSTVDDATLRRGDRRMQCRWWTDEALSALAPSPAPRTCTTELELDADITHIQNARDKLTSQVANDSQAALVPQLAQLWDDERLRRAAQNLDPTPSQAPSAGRVRPTLTDSALFGDLRKQFAELCAQDAARISNGDELARQRSAISHSDASGARSHGVATAAEVALNRCFGQSPSTLVAPHYANNAMLAVGGDDDEAGETVASRREAYLQSQAVVDAADEAESADEHSAYSQRAAEARRLSDLEMGAILDDIAQLDIPVDDAPPIGVGSREHSENEEEEDDGFNAAMRRSERDGRDILASQMEARLDATHAFAEHDIDDIDEDIDSDVIFNVPQIDGGTERAPRPRSRRAVRFGPLAFDDTAAGADVARTTTAVATHHDVASTTSSRRRRRKRKRRVKTEADDARDDDDDDDDNNNDNDDSEAEVNTNVDAIAKQEAVESPLLPSPVARERSPPPPPVLLPDSVASRTRRGSRVNSFAISREPTPKNAVKSSTPAPPLSSTSSASSSLDIDNLLVVPISRAQPPTTPDTVPFRRDVAPSSSSAAAAAATTTTTTTNPRRLARAASQTPEGVSSEVLFSTQLSRRSVERALFAESSTDARVFAAPETPPPRNAPFTPIVTQPLPRANEYLSAQVPFVAGSRSASQRAHANCLDSFTALTGGGGTAHSQSLRRREWLYNLPPPSARAVRADLKRRGERDTEHREPFYADVRDRPAVAPVFAGMRFVLPTSRVADLPEFDTTTVSGAGAPLRSALAHARTLPRERGRQQATAYDVVLTPARPPPSAAMVRADIAALNGAGAAVRAAEVAAEAIERERERSPSPWDPAVPPAPRARALPVMHAAQQRQRADEQQRKVQASQIEAATQRDPHEFVFSQEPAETPGASGETNNHITLLSVEVHCETRATLEPNPTMDAVCAIAYCVKNDDELDADRANYRYRRGVLYWWTDARPARFAPLRASAKSGVVAQRCASEIEMLTEFVRLVRDEDPDIVAGFEVQQTSLGYLVERAAVLGVDLCEELARMPSDEYERARLEAQAQREAELEAGQKQKLADGGAGRGGPDAAAWNVAHNAGVAIAGRIVFNVWRLLRSELTLRIYSFGNVVYHVLHRRMPEHDAHVLHAWYVAPETRSRCIEYVVARAVASVELLSHLNVIGRTAELARLFGIDFQSVLTRGSQYRVESMMLRLTKQQNYVLVAPSKQQVANQRAPECIPLVMEPQSAFYTDPVLVLDFQSLYPSIVIAYNICFSTCLGPLGNALAQPRKFGVGELPLPPGLLAFLGLGDAASATHDDLAPFLTPNGVMFAPASVRVGVLPRMLREILETRVMVKAALKRAKQSGDRALARMLDARQFGLKMIANVTYGYTSASFTGRMPCAEVADSIVQTARETLESAIRLVNNSREWDGAHVVYGDTDSIFIRVPGATKRRAFEIGEQISAAVTAMNPAPVHLKFEKVYFPSVLLTKKRYVGFAYESRAQELPAFDAKGIETVRRDTCPAVAKVMEQSLRTLFVTKDVSAVRRYVQRQFAKIMQDRVSLRDFVFAKEVRLGSYSANAVPPPAALVSLKRMQRDPRAEPRYGERVRYAVVYGPPNAPLMDLVVAPREIMSASHALHVNATYYISKQIVPALARVFNLLGADPAAWFRAMPNVARANVRAAAYAAEAAAQAAQSDVVNDAAAVGVDMLDDDNGDDDDVGDVDVKQRRVLKVPHAGASFSMAVHRDMQHTLGGVAAPTAGGPNSTIDQYYMSQRCAICDSLTSARQHLCGRCRGDMATACYVLESKRTVAEAQLDHLRQTCFHCIGEADRAQADACVSLDCPVFFEKARCSDMVQEANHLLKTAIPD
jgi:DNA polymerase elongation subunit (family B)